MNDCQCGRPIGAAGGSLCAACAEALRANLHKIADRWAYLEQCLMEREPVDNAEQGKAKHGMVSVGTAVNEAAVRARRACTDAVWFALQVIRDDADDAGRPFTPPATSATRSQDDTPTIARWLAVWQVAHITHRTARDTAEEIARDVAAAEAATYRVVEIGPERKVKVGLPCEQHGTSDLGERVPCPGEMEAKLSRQMPDLVCSVDASHRIPPDVWSRQYWKRAHIVSEDGARRLVDKLRG